MQNSFISSFLCFQLVLSISSGFALAAESCKDWVGTEQQRSNTLHIVEKTFREAGSLVLEIRKQRDFELQTKAHAGDLKTKADCGSQNKIFTQLSKSELKQTAIYKGEEKCQETNEIVESSKSKNKGTGAFWLLDPVDGTTNLVQGIHYFSISLALVVDQQICFGAVYAPVFNEFYYAFQGHGSHLKNSEYPDGKVIQVSKTDQLKNTMWFTGTEGGSSDPKAIQKNKNTATVMTTLLPLTRDMRRQGSAALDLASVASGVADAYFEYSQGLNFWDIAAGILLVQEAGGQVDLLFEDSHSGSNQVSLSTEANGKIDVLREEESQQEQPKTELKKRKLAYILATNKKSNIHSKFKKLLDQILRSGAGQK